MSDGSLRVDLAVHTKGDRHARVAKPIARPMVLQIPRGVRAKIQKANNIRAITQGDWPDVEGIVRSARH